MIKFILGFGLVCYLAMVGLNTSAYFDTQSKLSNYPQCFRAYETDGVEGLDRCIGTINYNRELSVNIMGYYDN